MHSRIVSVITQAGKGLITAYKTSETGRLVKKATDALAKLVDQSVVVAWVSTNTPLDTAIGTSQISQGLSRVAKALSPLKNWLGASLIVRLATHPMAVLVGVALQVVSYAFLPTALSMMVSVVLTAQCLVYAWLAGIKWSSPVLAVTSGLVVASLLLASVLNPVTMDTLQVLLIYLTTLVYIFVIMQVGVDKRVFYVMLYALALLVLLTSAYGFLQVVVGAPQDPGWLDEAGGATGMRIYSVFGNPNVFGEFLVLMLPLMFAGLTVEKKWWQKLFFLCVLVAGFGNIMLTLSRGSMLSLIGAMVLLVVLRDHRYMPLLVLGVLASPLILPQSILERLLTVFQGGDSSVDYRVSIYMSSMAMIKEYLFTGVGLGNFKEIFKIYAFTASKSYHAHNTLLMIWAETGLVGLTVFVSFVLLWIREVFSTRKHKSAMSYYAYAALAGIAGCTVNSLFEHIFHHYDILFYFFLTIAFGYMAAKLSKEEVHG